MELPSKELMSEIYKTRCIKVSMTYETIIDFYIKGNEGREAVNIYELMHLMKEWLTKQGYIFSVYHHLDTVAISVMVAISVLRENDSGYISPSMSVLTEFEAVTKACEWILKESK